MSIFKKSDVKNHLSLRFRTKTYLNVPVSQPHATGITVALSGVTGANPSLFAEDYSAEHTTGGASSAPSANSTGSTGSQKPETSKSAQA